MVRRNETRKRRRYKSSAPPGHQLIALREHQTLFTWHISDPTKITAISAPPGIFMTQFIISKTEGIRWKVGAPPVDGIDY